MSSRATDARATAARATAAHLELAALYEQMARHFELMRAELSVAS